MHKWSEKWNNERSDGTREDVIIRHCIHCDIEQRIIYSRDKYWPRVVTFNVYGKEVQDLPACNRSDDDDVEQKYTVKNPRGPNIRTRRKLESSEVTTTILRKVPAARIVDVPQEQPQPQQPGPLLCTVNLVVVHQEQLATLVADAIRAELSKVFKI